MKGFTSSQIRHVQRSLERIERTGLRPSCLGFQGKSTKWSGVNELPENFVNDKRSYYRKIYLKSPHWKALKLKKLKATPYCERCPSKRNLDVHHRNYRNLYDVLLSDLETLCRKCHKEEHDG